MRDKQEDSIVKVMQILVSIVVKFRQLTNPSGLNMFLKYSRVDRKIFCCLSLCWLLRLVHKEGFQLVPIVIGVLGNVIINEYLYGSVCRFTPSNEKIRFSDVK